jgi:hypothetical protein
MKKENVFEGDLAINSTGSCPYTKITGSLYIHANAKLDALENVGGDLSIYANAKLDAPKLENVGGYLYIYADAKLDAPKLENVGGYLSIYANAKLDALENVGGDLYIYANAKLDALENVGGDLSIYANAKLDAPKLENVGGYLSIHANAKLDAPKLEHNVPATSERCRSALMKSLARSGYSWADGILARIISRRGNVSRVVICGKTKVSYLVTDGEVWSHGATLSEARDSLIFKIGKRDPSKFKAWSMDRVVSKRDAIRAYRTITGACEGGVRGWMEQHKVPEKMTVKNIISLTAGAYGADTFKKFFAQAKGGA